MRKGIELFWVILLLLLLVYFFNKNAYELPRLIHILRHAKFEFILLLLILQTVIFILFGAISSLTLRFLGYKISLWEATKLYLTRTALGTITPASGLTSSVIYTESLVKKKIPREVSVYSLFLKSFLGHLSFAFILIPGLYITLAKHLLPSTALPALIIFALLTLALIILFIIFHRTENLRFTFLPQKIKDLQGIHI